MGNLLENKESALRKKNVRADINKMWEIYRAHMRAGHIRAPDPLEDAHASASITSDSLPPKPARIWLAEYPSTVEAAVFHGSSACPPNLDVASPCSVLSRQNTDTEMSRQRPSHAHC